jgi:hypothetical protein
MIDCWALAEEILVRLRYFNNMQLMEKVRELIADRIKTMVPFGTTRSQNSHDVLKSF